MSRAHHLLDRLLRDELAHAVVDAASGKNDLWDVADLFGLVREVIRIDADAVSADQAWTKLEEVPLRACSFEHFHGIDSEAAENDCEFVHQSDVEIALRVLD